MMFRVLVLQTPCTLSDDQTEYHLRDRLAFMRVKGIALHETIPDAKTIWIFREQPVRAGAFERLFARFDAALLERGYLAKVWQFFDATILQVRRPRLSQAKQDVVKGGGVPEDWKRECQIFCVRVSRSMLRKKDSVDHGEEDRRERSGRTAEGLRAA